MNVVRRLYVILDADTGNVVPPFTAETEGMAIQAFKKFALDAKKQGSLDLFELYGIGDYDYVVSESKSDDGNAPDYVYHLPVCSLISFDSPVLVYSSSDLDVKEVTNE